MTNILNILKNRRIWIAVVSLFMAIMTYIGHPLAVDSEVLTDNVVNVTSISVDLIVAILALWSLVKPKTK